MINKIHLILGVLIFLLVTEFVYLIDTNSDAKKIHILTKKAVFTEKKQTELKENKIAKQNITFKNVESKINQEKISSQHSIKINNSQKHKDVNVINFDGIKNEPKSSTEIKNSENSKNSKKIKINGDEIELSEDELEEIQKQLENKNITLNQNDIEFDDYIDWNTWRSRFLNQILDDSDSITSLNNYEAGSWLYFSFNVTNKGEIKDIKIYSFFLNDIDKELFRNLIKSYEYKKITEFPLNSRRIQVKVKAFYVLDNEEKRTKPQDFYDNERIRR